MKKLTVPEVAPAKNAAWNSAVVLWGWCAGGEKCGLKLSYPIQYIARKRMRKTCAKNGGRSHEARTAEWHISP